MLIGRSDDDLRVCCPIPNVRFARARARLDPESKGAEAPDQQSGVSARSDYLVSSVRPQEPSWSPVAASVMRVFDKK